MLVTTFPPLCIFLLSTCLIILLLTVACVKVGPDFVRSTADVRASWLEADSARIQSAPSDDRLWCMVFKNPVLDHLMPVAYHQSIPLRLAGVRVFEARARLGAAISAHYPEAQQAVGGLGYKERFYEKSIALIRSLMHKIESVAPEAIITDCLSRRLHFQHLLHYPIFRSLEMITRVCEAADKSLGGC
jgi:hypothetical protein